jgi:hypothetical protein
MGKSHGHDLLLKVEGPNASWQEMNLSETDIAAGGKDILGLCN